MPLSELHKAKRKKNYLVLAIIVFICVLIWAVTIIRIDSANAGEIVSCGAASTYDLDQVSPVDACDIYSRQLQYREEAIKLRGQMQARSLEYARPSAILRKQYRAKLDALHDSIEEDNVPSFFVTQEDLEDLSKAR